jgi:hypothetical protein
VKKYIVYILSLSMFLALPLTGCANDQESAKALLDKYFTSAEKQDYASTYTYYNDEYKKKVPKDEFIKKRKDASLLQSYKILSMNIQKDQGQASVELTWAPSEKLKRTQPVTVKVQEDLVKEKDGWKIKVWQ